MNDDAPFPDLPQILETLSARLDAVLAGQQRENEMIAEMMKAINNSNARLEQHGRAILGLLEADENLSREISTLKDTHHNDIVSIWGSFRTRDFALLISIIIFSIVAVIGLIALFIILSRIA